MNNGMMNSEDENTSADRIFSSCDIEKYKNGDEALVKLYNMINEVFPMKIKVIGS